MVAALKIAPMTGNNEPANGSRMPQGRGGLSQDRFRAGPEDRPLARLGTRGGRRNSRPAEQRMFPRKQVNGRVMGKRLDHSVSAHREPALNLSMEDLSVGGLRACSQGPASPGEHVVVFFPPEGSLRGWDAYGRVVRCNQRLDGGFELALEFDTLPAA